MTTRLNDDKIARIVRAIEGWHAPFTWDALVHEVARRLGETWTKQSLARNPRIARAVQLKRELLRGDGKGALR